MREIRDAYGMSELMGANATCMAGKYHLNPWTVPYLFGDDGTLLERRGTQKGRFGAVDLMASSYSGRVREHGLSDHDMGPSVHLWTKWALHGTRHRAALRTSSTTRCRVPPPRPFTMTW